MDIIYDLLPDSLCLLVGLEAQCVDLLFELQMQRFLVLLLHLSLLSPQSCNKFFGLDFFLFLNPPLLVPCLHLNTPFGGRYTLRDVDQAILRSACYVAIIGSFW